MNMMMTASITRFLFLMRVTPRFGFCNISPATNNLAFPSCDHAVSASTQQFGWHVLDGIGFAIDGKFQLVRIG